MRQWSSYEIIRQLHIRKPIYTLTPAPADTGITDLAKEAAMRQMEVLGISDHGTASMGSAGLSYFRSLFLCELRRFDISLLYGTEANILAGEG